MKIDILTLFPGLFDGFVTESIIKRCIDKGIVDINVVDFREYSELNNKQVDDTPYGGGGGMVLRCEPLFSAIRDLKTSDSLVILMTPDGCVYNESMALDLSKEKHLIFVCGHYEGFDERIRTLVDIEISIGDYVLTGGELPAMVVSDSIIRLLDGAISSDSLVSESFTDNLLDYPTYTKPRVFEGMEVPRVLLSGDHKRIDEWRNSKRIEKTKEKRPDLMK